MLLSGQQSFFIVVSCTPASDRRDAGYKDVNQFMKAFEKSCRLLEEYQKASEDKTQDDPKEKESVLSKLKAYEEEAKHRPSKSKSKHKDSQEL